MKKYPLSVEPTYYFAPIWSPDSKKIAFYDNRLNTYVLDLVTGKVLSRTDPAGRTTSYQYDAAGRVTAVTAPGDRTTKTDYTSPLTTTTTSHRTQYSGSSLTMKAAISTASGPPTARPIAARRL